MDVGRPAGDYSSVGRNAQRQTLAPYAAARARRGRGTQTGAGVERETKDTIWPKKLVLCNSKDRGGRASSGGERT